MLRVRRYNAGQTGFSDHSRPNSEFGPTVPPRLNLWMNYASPTGGYMRSWPGGVLAESERCNAVRPNAAPCGAPRSEKNRNEAKTAPDSRRPRLSEGSCNDLRLFPFFNGGFRLLLMKRPAIFFDRDNTLIVSNGYLGDPEKVVLMNGASSAREAVSRARSLGFATVVCSNQSGVARGMFDEDAVNLVNRKIDQMLLAVNRAAVIDLTRVLSISSRSHRREISAGQRAAQAQAGNDPRGRGEVGAGFVAKLGHRRCAARHRRGKSGWVQNHPASTARRSNVTGGR